MATQIQTDFAVSANRVLDGYVPNIVNVPGTAFIKPDNAGQMTIPNASDRVQIWASNHVCRIDCGLSNLSFQINFVSDRAGGGTANDLVIHTRRNNANNLPTDAYEFLFDIHNDLIKIRKIVSGVITELASTAFAFNNNTQYTLKVVSSGSDHEVFVDGSPKLTATNNEVASSTYVGFGTRTADSDKAAADDLLIETISVGSVESVPTSVIENQDSSWASSTAGTILDVLGDNNTATYTYPVAINKTLRVKFGVVNAPVAPNKAKVIINLADPQNLPAIPLNATAAKVAASETALNLTWDAVAGATGYKVYQVPPSVASDTEIADVATNSWQHTALTSWVDYYYKVAAYNAAGTGGKSVSFSERPHDLTAPSTPTINSATPLGNVVKFDVTKATDSASGVSEHELYNGVNFFSTFTIPDFDIDTGEELPVQATVPQSFGTTYDWKFRAKDAAGNTGNFSNIVQTTGKISATPLTRMLRR